MRPPFRSALIIAGASLLAIPAIGQHVHDAAPAATPAPTPADPHAGHVMPKVDEHEGSAIPAPSAPAASNQDAHSEHTEHASQTAADLPVGREPAPAAAGLRAADAIFGAAAMNKARAVLMEEHGGAALWKVMLDQAEYRVGSSAGYAWNGEAWYGGDLNRFVLKTEGAGSARDGVEEAELQALYSRAIGPYTDLQTGVRQDMGGFPTTYAAFGMETVLPYWFKADAALFVSHRGDALVRLEGSYDVLLTQSIVLQPNLEFNFAMQDIPGAQIGSGLSTLTTGLRLRYDVTRQFSPYVGINFDRSFGTTAALQRAAGHEVESISFVLGVRAFL